MTKTLLPLLVLLCQSASFAQGSPITDAYRQLRLLSSSTQTGISYRDFGLEIRKVNGLVDIALEDSKPSKLTQKLEEIKTTYSDINELWGCRFSSKFISVALSHCLGIGFQQRNPIAAQVLRERLAANQFAEMDVPTSVLVGSMFGKASAQVKQLGDMLKAK